VNYRGTIGFDTLPFQSRRFPAIASMAYRGFDGAGLDGRKPVRKAEINGEAPVFRDFDRKQMGLEGIQKGVINGYYTMGNWDCYRDYSRIYMGMIRD